jgi:hypothetical protein
MFSALKNKKKIVIISSPRTGSTPLLYDIHHYLEQNDNRLLLLNEPIVKPEKTNSNKITSGDIDIIICRQNFILKAHASDIKTLYSDFFNEKINTDEIAVVRIKRRQIVDQCVSFYVSSHTNLWFNKGNNNLLLPTIKLPVVRTQMIDIFSDLTKFNTICDTIPCNLVLDVVYEDYTFLTNDVVKNQRIANYEEIYNEFTLLADSFSNKIC